MSQYQLKMPKGLGDVRPIIKAKQYDSMDQSRQTFDGLKLIQAINGNLVLRGRNGQRDMIFPLHKAWQRFFRLYEMCSKLRMSSRQLTYEFCKVLQDYAANMLEAIKQRKKQNMQLPGFINATTLQELSAAMENLRKLG